MTHVDPLGGFRKGRKDCDQKEECLNKYRGADKSLARPGRKQTTATEDLEFRVSYL